MGRRPKPWYWKKRKTWMVTLRHERHNLGPEKKAALDEFHRLMLTEGQAALPDSVDGVMDDFLAWTEANRGSEPTSVTSTSSNRSRRCTGR